MGDERSKTSVPTRPPRSRPKLDPRLEELRQILRKSKSVDDTLSDERVIEDERAFKRRFGFEWGRRHREALIRLKHEKELTDSEIKLFWRTSNLQRTPLGVRLSASLWVAAVGGLQLLYFGVLLAMVVLLAGPRLMGFSINALKLWGVVLGLSAF